MSPPSDGRAHGRAARRRRRRGATVNPFDVCASCAGGAGEARVGLAVQTFAGRHGVRLARAARLLRAPRAALGLLLGALCLLARLLLLRRAGVLQLDADELVRDRVAVPDVEPPPRRE